MGWDGQLLPSGYLLESGKADTPLNLEFPGGGERSAPLAWSPAGLDTVGRMRSVVLPCRGRFVEGASERSFPPLLSCYPTLKLSPNTAPERWFLLGGHPVKGLACMVEAGPLWLVGGESKRLRVAVKGAQRVPRNKFEGASAVGGL